MLGRRFLIMTVILLAMAAQAFAIGTLDYNNIGTPFYFHAWYPSPNYFMGDDVHRTTSNPLTGVDLDVFSALGSASVNLYIYSNPDDTSASATLLATYTNIGTVPGGDNTVHFDLPGAPLVAPADLWIGITSPQEGVMINWYTDAAVLGTTHNLMGQGTLAGWTVGRWPGPDWGDANYRGSQGIRTYSQEVPEPGSLLALGTGLVGLLGFATRRRR